MTQEADYLFDPMNKRLLGIEPSLLERADELNQSRIEAIRKHGRESLFAEKDGDNE